MSKRRVSKFSTPAFKSEKKPKKSSPPVASVFSNSSPLVSSVVSTSSPPVSSVILDKIAGDVLVLGMVHAKEDRCK